MRHESDLRAQPFHVEISNVDTVEIDGARIDIVEAQQELHERALAAARRSDERVRAVGRTLERERLQYRHARSSRIVKVNVVEANVTAERGCGWFEALFVVEWVDFRLALDDSKDASRRARALLLVREQ